MPASKISALPAATALTGAELTAVVQGGVTKQATVTQLGAAIAWTDNSASVTHTGNVALTTLKTVTIPAGTLGPNGALIISPFIYCTNPALGTSSFYLKINGTSVSAYENLGINDAAESPMVPVPKIFNARGTTAICVVSAAGGMQVITVDLTLAFDIIFQVQNTNAGDTAGFPSISVIVIGG